MRNRVFGLIGVVWGGAVLIYGLTRRGEAPAPNAEFAAGQTAGLVFGGVMLVVGLYYLFQGDGGGGKARRRR